MSFIRGRQRVVTALFPHQGNRRFIVPGRNRAGPSPGPTVRRWGIGGDATGVGYNNFLGFGSLVPDDWDSYTCVVFLCLKTERRVALNFDFQQVSGLTTIFVTVAGYGTVQVDWEAANNRYTAIDDAFTTWCEARENTTVDVQFSGPAPATTAADLGLWFELSGLAFGGDDTVEAIMISARDGWLLPEMMQKARWSVFYLGQPVAVQSIYIDSPGLMFLNVPETAIPPGSVVSVQFDGEQAQQVWQVQV